MNIKRNLNFIKSIFPFSHIFGYLFFTLFLFGFVVFIYGYHINSTFMDFTQNWFDTVSIFVNILAILLAWIVSYYFYNKEKIDKERDDNRILDQEILFFKKNIKRILPAINHQIKVFDDFPITNQFNRTISIDTAFMSYFDLKNFYVKIGLKGKDQDKLNLLNELLINLGGLNNYYEKEKTVFLALQKYVNLAPKLNVERGKAIEKANLYFNLGKNHPENKKNIVIKYLDLLNNLNSMDYRKLNEDCDELTKKNNESSIVFEIDDSYRMVRTDFMNLHEDFNNEFEILKSNLKDAKASIEKYLN